MTVILRVALILVVIVALEVSSLVRGNAPSFGFATFFQFVSPVIPAQADDDDDDDDDDDRRVVRQRPPPPPPEFVLSTPDPALVDTIAALGYTIIAQDTLASLGTTVVRLSPPAGVSLDAARTQIAALAPEAVLDLNHIYRPNELTCDPDDCRAFAMVDWTAPGAACDAAPSIGMIDTAINRDHPALTGSAIEMLVAQSEGRRGSARVHGTAVAALLVGDSGSRTPGLLPNARLVAVDAFHRDRRAEDAADAFDLARALDLLLSRDIGIVNMSLTGPDNLLLAGLVAQAVERDIVLVAAAGNGGPRAAPAYPAAYPGVVAVTAVDRRGAAYRQAATGPHIDFAAPGVRLWTAASISGGRLRSGTSFAAPFVTASLAARQAADPGRPAAEIVADFAASAIDLGPSGRDDVFGHGLVRAPEACARAARGG